MGEKMRAAREYKAMMAAKWENKDLTLADMEEMDKENEIYKQLAKAATEEWLAEKGLKK